ncbi:MAG TPA: MDR family MFS transporter [Ktedonobacterales bacterium]|nr:MDR family MFS transporter [Ktedonobacterales bacterium]
MAETLSIADVNPPLSIRETFGRGRLIPLIAGLMLGMLLAALDQTIVSTALPQVIGHLSGSSQDYTWVITAYLLASTVAVPIYGKLSDIYGRRVFFLGGMVVFLLGSALSGTSQNMTQLIVYRALQGLGAGALMPIAQAIIGDIFPPAERGKWQGLFIAVFGFATILGPVLGGSITDNWGWRWIFYINMPVGAFALLIAGLAMPKLAARRQHRIDYFGSATLMLWAVPLLLALSLGGQTVNGTELAWNSWQILGLFGFAAVMLVAFFIIELHAAEPIISPRLFKSSIFSVSIFTTLLLSAGMFGAIAFLPLFVQGALGQSATNSGLVITPMMVGFMVSSLIGGQLLSRTGRYKLLALVGFVIAAVGMYLLSRMGIATTNGELVRNMIVTGLGIGVMMSLFTIVVQNAFPFRQLGEVTATLSFFRQMGSTIGLAVFGVVLSHTLVSNLQANIPAPLKPYVSASQLSQLSPTQSSASPSAALQSKLAQFGPQGVVLLQQLEHAIKTSLAASITQVFLIGSGLMMVCFLATLFLREIPLRKSHGHEPAVGAPGSPATEEGESMPVTAELGL